MRAREHIGGSFFGEASFSSEDHFFVRFFLKERKRLGFESKEKRCVRKGRHLS